jgi:hypothetical protein
LQYHVSTSCSMKFLLFSSITIRPHHAEDDDLCVVFTVVGVVIVGSKSSLSYKSSVNMNHCEKWQKHYSTFAKATFLHTHTQRRVIQAICVGYSLSGPNVKECNDENNIGSPYYAITEAKKQNGKSLVSSSSSCAFRNMFRDIADLVARWVHPQCWN